MSGFKNNTYKYLMLQIKSCMTPLSLKLCERGAAHPLALKVDDDMIQHMLYPEKALQPFGIDSSPFLTYSLSTYRPRVLAIALWRTRPFVMGTGLLAALFVVPIKRWQGKTSPHIPLLNQGSSRASWELVPNSEPVLLISTAKELALSQESWFQSNTNTLLV